MDYPVNGEQNPMVPDFSKKRSPRGMVGIVMVVLILGYLMAISTSNVLLVRSELSGLEAGSKPQNAEAAAWAGVFYYISVLNSTDTTFLTTFADYSRRIHFLSNSTFNVSNGASQQIATYTGAATATVYTFPNIATSGWMFASGTSSFPSDAPDIASSGLFYVKTFVDLTNSSTIASYVYVKSLGVFREMDDSVPVASYYSQLMVQLEIVPSRKKIFIRRARRAPIEYATSTSSLFHTNRNLPW